MSQIFNILVMSLTHEWIKSSCHLSSNPKQWLYHQSIYIALSASSCLFLVCFGLACTGISLNAVKCFLHRPIRKFVFRISDDSGVNRQLTQTTQRPMFLREGQRLYVIGGKGKDSFFWNSEQLNTRPSAHVLPVARNRYSTYYMSSRKARALFTLKTSLL